MFLRKQDYNAWKKVAAVNCVNYGFYALQQDVDKQDERCNVMEHQTN